MSPRRAPKSENFVTVLDMNFLPRGLALHESLTAQSRPFLLWILCVDEETFQTVQHLSISTIRALRVDYENYPELSAVETQRSRKEFCWTLTPFSILEVFDAEPELARVTYVDADVMIFRDWRPIMEELEVSEKSILLTEHGFHPLWDQTSTSGRFCVQFLPVGRSARDSAISRWASQCIEWCFDYSINGLIGDQGYLNDWPNDFPDLVTVARENSWFQGPWNTFMHSPSKAIIYHFHGLREHHSGKFLLGRYPLSPGRRNLFYRPYLNRLQAWNQHFWPEKPAPLFFERVSLVRDSISELRSRLVGHVAHFVWALLGAPTQGRLARLLSRRP